MSKGICRARMHMANCLLTRARAPREKSIFRIATTPFLSNRPPNERRLKSRGTCRSVVDVPPLSPVNRSRYFPTLLAHAIIYLTYISCTLFYVERTIAFTNVIGSREVISAAIFFPRVFKRVGCTQINFDNGNSSKACGM